MKLITNHDSTVLERIRLALQQNGNCDIAVAYVRLSGVRLLCENLTPIAEAGGLPVITSDQFGYTERRAIAALLEIGKDVGKYTADRTFHLKTFIFGPEVPTAIVGSSNLTGGALTDSLEWNIEIEAADDGRLYDHARDEFNDLWDSKDVTPVTPATIGQMFSEGTHPTVSEQKLEVIVIPFGGHTKIWGYPQKVVSTSVSIKGSQVCARVHPGGAAACARERQAEERDSAGPGCVRGIVA